MWGDHLLLAQVPVTGPRSWPAQQAQGEEGRGPKLQEEAAQSGLSWGRAGLRGPPSGRAPEPPGENN